MRVLIVCAVLRAKAVAYVGIGNNSQGICGGESRGDSHGEHRSFSLPLSRVQLDRNVSRSLPRGLYRQVLDTSYRQAVP